MQVCVRRRSLIMPLPTFVGPWAFPHACLRGAPTTTPPLGGWPILVHVHAGHGLRLQATRAHCRVPLIIQIPACDCALVLFLFRLR